MKGFTFSLSVQKLLVGMLAVLTVWALVLKGIIKPGDWVTLSASLTAVIVGALGIEDKHESVTVELPLPKEEPKNDVKETDAK